MEGAIGRPDTGNAAAFHCIHPTAGSVPGLFLHHSPKTQCVSQSWFASTEACRWSRSRGGRHGMELAGPGCSICVPSAIHQSWQSCCSVTDPFSDRPSASLRLCAQSVLFVALELLQLLRIRPVLGGCAQGPSTRVEARSTKVIQSLEALQTRRLATARSYRVNSKLLEESCCIQPLCSRLFRPSSRCGCNHKIFVCVYTAGFSPLTHRSDLHRLEFNTRRSRPLCPSIRGLWTQIGPIRPVAEPFPHSPRASQRRGSGFARTAI